MKNGDILSFYFLVSTFRSEDKESTIIAGMLATYKLKMPLHFIAEALFYQMLRNL